MEYKTILRYSRNTPRKTRYVADMIRNKPVTEAQRILKYTPKRVSYFLYKLVNSAIANATTRDANLAPENLFISEITVGDGPAFKRLRYGSMGRANQVKKRTSHVTLILKTINQKENKSSPARPEATLKSGQEPSKRQKTETNKEKKPKINPDISRDKTQ